MADFYEKINRFIEEKKLEPLTSMGEDRMRRVSKALASGGDMTKEKALEAFLDENKFGIRLKKSDMEDLKDLL
jgi:hypothetical protein